MFILSGLAGFSFSGPWTVGFFVVLGTVISVAVFYLAFSDWYKSLVIIFFLCPSEVILNYMYKCQEWLCKSTLIFGHEGFYFPRDS